MRGRRRANGAELHIAVMPRNLQMASGRVNNCSVVTTRVGGKTSSRPSTAASQLWAHCVHPVVSRPCWRLSSKIEATDVLCRVVMFKSAYSNAR